MPGCSFMDVLKQTLVFLAGLFLSLALCLMLSTLAVESAELTLGGDVKFGSNGAVTVPGRGFDCQEFDMHGSGKVGRWQGEFKLGWEIADGSKGEADHLWYGTMSASGRPTDGLVLKFCALRGRSFISSQDLLGIIDGSRYDTDTTGLILQAVVGDRVAARAARVDMVDNVGDDGCLTFVEAEITPSRRWNFLLDAAVLSPHPVEHALVSGVKYTTFAAQKILSVQVGHELRPSLSAAVQVAAIESERLTKTVYIEQNSVAGCVRLATEGRTWSRRSGGFVQIVGASSGFRSYLGDKVVDEGGGAAWEAGGYLWLTPALGLRTCVSSSVREEGNEESSPDGEWEVRYVGSACRYQVKGDTDECTFIVTLPKRGYRGRLLKAGIQYRWSSQYWRTNVSGLGVLGSSCTLDYRQDPSAFRAAMDIGWDVWNAGVVYRKHRMTRIEQMFVEIGRDTDFGSISLYYGVDDGGDLDSRWKTSPVFGVSCQVKL